jgi:hypothetical protein
VFEKSGAPLKILRIRGKRFILKKVTQASFFRRFAA